MILAVMNAIAYRRLKNSGIFLRRVKCFAIIPCWSCCTKFGKVHFRLLGTDVYQVKANNERLTTAIALSSEPQIRQFHGVIWQTTSKNCTKKRAAPLFFLIQPIKSLVYGVEVAVVVY